MKKRQKQTKTTLRVNSEMLRILSLSEASQVVGGNTADLPCAGSTTPDCQFQ